MDREKEIICNYSQIPEAEMMDSWEEGSEYVMYDGWDRVKDWLRRVWKRK